MKVHEPCNNGQSARAFEDGGMILCRAHSKHQNEMFSVATGGETKGCESGEEQHEELINLPPFKFYDDGVSPDPLDGQY
jgi:hypothetical protein